ncbi:hypothetical protein M885DRAFT_506469 [Pelagophyceae sp. CCMP2097]|nr:hypothetical protein M885DRAFT_506469 [Pelagophyceae sp. CCMP2097]
MAFPRDIELRGMPPPPSHSMDVPQPPTASQERNWPRREAPRYAAPEVSDEEKEGEKRPDEAQSPARFSVPRRLALTPVEGKRRADPSSPPSRAPDYARTSRRSWSLKPRAEAGREDEEKKPFDCFPTPRPLERTPLRTRPRYEELASDSESPPRRRDTARESKTAAYGEFFGDDCKADEYDRRAEALALRLVADTPTRRALYDERRGGSATPTREEIDAAAGGASPTDAATRACIDDVERAESSAHGRRALAAEKLEQRDRQVAISLANAEAAFVAEPAQMAVFSERWALLVIDADFSRAELEESGLAGLVHMSAAALAVHVFWVAVLALAVAVALAVGAAHGDAGAHLPARELGATAASEAFALAALVLLFRCIVRAVRHRDGRCFSLFRCTDFQVYRGAHVAFAVFAMAAFVAAAANLVIALTALGGALGGTVAPRRSFVLGLRTAVLVLTCFTVAAAVTITHQAVGCRRRRKGDLTDDVHAADAADDSPRDARSRRRYG